MRCALNSSESFQVLKHIRILRHEAGLRGDEAVATAAWSQWTEKCRSFLKRAKENDPRPKAEQRLKRQKTFEWLLSTDNQLKQLGLPGWEFLCVDPDPMKRGDPASWPAWSCCPDQGPDSVAAINFLVRELGLNLDPTFCASHGAHTDTKLALKHSGLWAHQLLVVPAWRAWRGPWGTDDRFEQVREVVEANFEVLSPASFAT